MGSPHKRSRHRPATSNTRSATQHDEAVPSPCYGNRYGAMDLHHRGWGTDARVADDGRVDINIKERDRKLSNLVGPIIHPGAKAPRSLWTPPCAGDKEAIGPIPQLNIVMHVVGSQGDIRPFIALGCALKQRCGHRVRLATHAKFKSFVEGQGLEFFTLGSDPADLMAFMVKNPGLMPGIDALRSGDIGKRRKDMTEVISGCWRSCFEDGDGTGPAISDADLPSRCPCDSQPFIADVLIANPPSFAHVHCAEKLGIPLHLMFTMPWSSPTHAFPHPLANIHASNTESAVANFVSYALVEMLTWQGLGDIINRFRERTLGLEPISVMWAPGITPRLRIPITYCWSPTLLPKPKDWGSHIDITGFLFLASGSDYEPPEALAKFLDSGPPPVYIGFGSIVIDQPDLMTKLIFDAIKDVGQRAIISQGWGGLNAEEIGLPDNVFLIGSCPHDWLFQRVSCVVHHGGAGTTAAGLSCQKPTVIVPFFGDQPFWGTMVSKAGAGPPPIPHKQLTADKLAAAIRHALEPGTQQRAEELGTKINQENGLDAGVESFHRQLRVETIQCVMSPSRPAVWRVRRTKIRLSALAATTLSHEGILDLHNLKRYRPREYDLEPGPRDPVSGGASALLGSIADLTMGFADIPAKLLRALPFAPFSSHKDDKHEDSRSSLPPTPDTRSSFSTDRTVPALDGSSIPDGDEVSAETVGIRKAERRAARKRRAKSLSTLTGKEMLAAGHAATQIVTAGLKSPMEFALNIAKGFHNAPKLYHDHSVRTAQKITGFESGIKAAGKEFGYGFYDGISGLVTQPYRGRSGGAAGVMKGIGKGIGGLILKPGAGVFALAGYTLNGVYKEVQKLFGSSVECYIVACRSKQGYDEWSQSTKEERDEIMARWYSYGLELQTRAARTPFAREWDMAARVLLETHPDYKHEKRRPSKRAAPEDLNIEDRIAPGSFDEALHRATHLLSDIIHLYKCGDRKSPFDEEEPTMQELARVKSTSGPHEDAMFEQALRESIAELRKADAEGDSENAYSRAVKAGMEAARRMSRDTAPRVSLEGAPIQREMGKLSVAEQGEAAEDRNRAAEDEAYRLADEGLDDVTEFAIWRTLTDQRHEKSNKK